MSWKDDLDAINDAFGRLDEEWDKLTEEEIQKVERALRNMGWHPEDLFDPKSGPEPPNKPL